MDKQGIIDASKKRREGERIFYTSCPANGCWDSACVLKCHMKDGKIFAIEPDDSINKNDSREDKAWEELLKGNIQARPCAMGHSWKKELYGETRLLHPMKLSLIHISPADNRMGGANVVWDYARVREEGPEIIHIDYRYNETAAGHPEEWLPIRTGTDAALVAGGAHELIEKGWVDLDFLHKYCQGYDEETMPASAKGQNKSYYDYIMGTGYDKVEKTPEWAAEITLVPAKTIRELARKLHEANSVDVVQGWGLQRHSNGESATRAVCMLALLTGNLGREGTNSGMREAEPPGAPVGSIPSSDDDPNGVPMNMVNAKISCYSWLKCIAEGSDFQKELDAADELALFMGAQDPEAAAAAAKIEAPKNGIKCLWNDAGNCITNQHGDVNRVFETLSDEKKCEFIVVCDTFMTDSAKYADILLLSLIHILTRPQAREVAYARHSSAVSRCYPASFAIPSERVTCQNAWGCAARASPWGVPRQ